MCNDAVVFCFEVLRLRGSRGTEEYTNAFVHGIPSQGRKLR